MVYRKGELSKGTMDRQWPHQVALPAAHCSGHNYVTKQHCTYRRLRAAGLRRFPANQTTRSIKLYHRQVYAYAYHRPKLDFVRSGTLDDKRPGDARFAALADFLEAIPTACPHDLFRREDDPKARASQATPTWADASRIIINSKRNAATDAAELIIPAVGNNKLRHETLQRFVPRRLGEIKRGHEKSGWRGCVRARGGAHAAHASHLQQQVQSRAKHD